MAPVVLREPQLDGNFGRPLSDRDEDPVIDPGLKR
jgi:hypothetical protein